MTLALLLGCKELLFFSLLLCFGFWFEEGGWFFVFYIFRFLLFDKIIIRIF